jgi:nitric oxide reductase activation protein
MYGKNSWALISDAAQLPLKMASLYKQLTAR